MKRLNDHNLGLIEKKFFRPMWRRSSGDYTYDFFREELFDNERVYIYILYSRGSLKIQKQRIEPNQVCVLRFTAQKYWELEVCAKAGMMSKVVYPTEEDLQQLIKTVLFRQDDFKFQPNPFGPNIQYRVIARKPPYVQPNRRKPSDS